MRSQVHLTSAAVNGLPSCHFTPCRRWKTSLVPSSSQAQSVASSGTMSERLFCATRWSNSTRLFITAIIGRSATTVVSSWIDMLAGLSLMYCLRTPPCFCANAGAAARITHSNPPAAVNAHSTRFILLPPIGRAGTDPAIAPPVCGVAPLSWNRLTRIKREGQRRRFSSPSRVRQAAAHHLKKVGDGIPVPFHCSDVVAQRSAAYAVQVAALVVICQGQVSHSDRFPEPHLFAPLTFSAGPGRDPSVD